MILDFGRTKAKREAFLTALHQAAQQRVHDLAHEWNLWRLVEDQTGGGAVDDEQRRWWDDVQQRLRAEFPDADQYALYWFLDREERKQWWERTRNFSITELLVPLWIATRPTPDALDALLQFLDRMITPSDPWHDGQYAIKVAARLERQQTGNLQRTAAVLRKALRLSTLQNHRWIIKDITRALLTTDAMSHIDDRLLSELLLAAPEELSRAEPTPRLNRLVSRNLNAALEGQADPRTLTGLCRYTAYSGADHFLAAVTQLERHPKAKIPLASGFQWEPAKNPLAWAVWVLVTIAPPKEQSPDLSPFSPATLLTAALLAPAWAPLLEPALSWPGLADLIRWLYTYGDTGHWREHRRDGAKADEEETGGVDREGALQAVALVGEERLARLMAHPVAKSRYRDGLYYLQACRGENGADVEAGFVKRDKRAVRALGLLPDEGDILQRYLALLRFAKEARQFGAQRQASEWQAVQDGLDNLAVTAGFTDRSQLEWAMEAQLAQEMDPSAQRWQIEDYTVWIEPDAKATLAVERNGKRVKSVPPAVRQAPEYEVIKEGREQLQAQWERVRQRLELAMATGEIMDREAFTPALTTPAGKAMLPFLVLRCWGPDPVVQLGADGSFERYQVAHPLTLSAAWLRRPIEQPFPQLTRETYTATPAELEQGRVRRFEGRQVRLGPLKEKLKRYGWRMGYEGGLERRLPGPVHAGLWFADGAAYFSATDVLTVGDLQFQGKIDELRFSELLREVDLATRAAAADKTAI